MLLSVCVVAYNHEKYIAECIDSILQQDIDFEYEILVGDDCSKDCTYEVLQKYKDKVNIIKRRENIGLCANTYDLLLKARGKYVFTIAGDDYLCATHILRNHVDFLEKNKEYYMVTGWGYLLDEKSGIIKESTFCETEKDYELKEFLENGSIPVAEGTMRNTFKEDELYNKYLLKGARNNEEMKLWMYILTHGKVHILPEQFYVYRYVNKEDATNYNSSHTLMEIFMDYYVDLMVLQKEFKGIYNLTPAILHKANAFCILFSESKKDFFEFIRILRVQDAIKLVLYKIYLKIYKYKEPKWWKNKNYLIRK